MKRFLAFNVQTVSSLKKALYIEGFLYLKTEIMFGCLGSEKTSHALIYHASTLSDNFLFLVTLCRSLRTKEKEREICYRIGITTKSKSEL